LIAAGRSGVGELRFDATDVGLTGGDEAQAVAVKMTRAASAQTTRPRIT
jgi:hypothetical protein